jgi:anti-sigma regulatory factor (Ser/Thr protein kinase)
MVKSLTVPATLDSLQKIRGFVKAAASEAGLSRARSYGLALAVDEIVTNIATHGYEEAGITGDIVVTAEITGASVEIVVEDMGTPFNPLLHAEPQNLETPLEERAEGGLGIFLAQKNVDSFRYEYAGGRNQNIFVMQLEPSSSLTEG